MADENASFGRGHRNHHASQKRARSQNGAWTPERRRRMREHAMRVQPWRWSTGPRTAAGKARSSMNALKHGDYSRQTMAGWCYLKAVRAILDLYYLRHDRAWQRRCPAARRRWPCSGYRRRSMGADLELSAARRLLRYHDRIENDYGDHDGLASELRPIVDQVRAWLRERMEVARWPRHVCDANNAKRRPATSAGRAVRP